MIGRNHLIGGYALGAGICFGTYALSKTLPTDNALYDATAYLIQFFTDFGDVPWFISGLLAFICFGIGSLLPDIDSPNSLLGRYVHLNVGHRTITHSIWPVLILWLLGWLVYPLWAWVALGYTIHLLLDTPSAAGVCWFWPISKYRRYGNGAFVKKRHVLKLYKTSSTSETVCVAVVVVFGVLLCAISIFAVLSTMTVSFPNWFDGLVLPNFS